MREQRSSSDRNMQEYFDFLEKLRDSGVTNMYGATPYLQKQFPELRHDFKRAVNILHSWFDTFKTGRKEESQIAITSWTRRGRQPRSRMEPQALSGTEGAAAVRLRIQRPGTIQTTPPGCGSRAFCGAVRSARQQRRGYPRR